MNHKSLWTLAAASLCLVLTACSPAPTPVPNQPSSSGSSAVSSQPPKPLPVIPVVKRWQPGQFQNGIQLYWHTTGTTEQLQASAARTLNYAAELHANSIGISFPIYTDGEFPTHVYAGPDTPSPTNLSVVLAAARARGYRVMLRPIIDESNIPTPAHPDYWRGSLQPKNVNDWFVSYDTMLTSYAAVAEHYGVDEFVAGTELFSLQPQTKQWQLLKTRLKQAGYTRDISYAVNWYGHSSVPFHTLGLDAYPAIDLSNNATVVQLTSALKQWLQERPQAVLRRLTIQEAGIPAESGMYPHPWYHGSATSQPDSLGLTIQSNWFRAVYEAARQVHAQGVYYWMLDSNADPSLGDKISQPTSGWIGRPAAQVIKNVFS